MTDINTALDASNEAIQQLLLAGERTRSAWTSPRAPGKWSPSQIVEHVARSLEESANMAAGQPSKFPKLPAVVHPIVRGLLFKRVLRKAVFPKAKTNKAMNPASGPATPAEGRVRLEAAHQKFDEACRQTASTRRADANDHLRRGVRGGLRAVHGTPHASSRQADGGKLAAEADGIRRATCESHSTGVRRPARHHRAQDVRRSRLPLPRSDVLRHRRERSDGANS